MTHSAQFTDAKNHSAWLLRAELNKKLDKLANAMDENRAAHTKSAISLDAYDTIHSTLFSEYHAKFTQLEELCEQYGWSVDASRFPAQTSLV